MATFFSRFGQSRRLLRALETIAQQQQQHTRLLERLVQHLAPLPLRPPSSADLHTTTSVAFSRDTEQGRIQDFVERCWRDLQREPTEEEICEFLDDRPDRPH